MKHWTLLGCGALGGVMAGLLAQAGHQVSLLRTFPPQQVPKEVKHPLLLSWWDLEGQHHEFNPDFLQTKDAANISLLLVTTKVYQVQVAMEPLIGQLPEATPILLLHNGMGTEAWVKRAFPANPLLIGITSNGALRLSAEEFRHTGSGETWFGAGNAAGNDWRGVLDVLAQALPHAAWSDEIRMKQWEKLVINAIINPLTALSGETNGSLLTRQEEVEALCHELMPLLQREGFNLPEEAWVSRVMAVAAATAPNYSSMQQDLVAGRPTEIDYITGYILREAQPLGLHMPLHQQLYDAISHRSPIASGISNFSI